MEVTDTDLVKGLQPTRKGERYIQLDVLRGLAILGILLMNIEFFTATFQSLIFSTGNELTGIDHAVDLLTEILVEGKFWVLFSLLFGMGFSLIQIRTAKAGRHFTSFFATRMLILLLIAIIHSVFIWAGDILLEYAVVGLILMSAFANTKTSRLWKYALAFFMLVLVILFFSSGSGEDATAIEGMFGKLHAGAADAYANGSYMSVTKTRLIDTLFGVVAFFVLIPLLLSIFLFGAWLVKSGIITRPEEHLPIFRKGLYFGLPAGLLLSIFAITGFQGFDSIPVMQRSGIATVCQYVGNVVLSFAYISAVILVLEKNGSLLKSYLAPVGRMALSNYILQSLVFTFIFYGYGLGYWEQLSRTTIFLMAVVFYLLQVAFSKWWMSRYNYGPLEWVWRRLTYGRLT